MNKGRRTFFIQLAGAGLLMPMVRDSLAADTPLKEDEPQAKQHAYVEDFEKVDVKRFPEFTPTQKCGSCQIFEDHGKGWGSCAIFPGKLVKETGWCDAWG